MSLRRIVAVAYPGNAASAHVLEKLAMTPQGPRSCYGAVLAEYALTLDQWRDARGCLTTRSDSPPEPPSAGSRQGPPR